jgi:general L-amino acid transport system substrate-binding protein
MAQELIRPAGRLPADWARRMIEAGGNYGEIYDRTIGKPLKLPRGMNALSSAGGILASAPLR